MSAQTVSSRPTATTPATTADTTVGDVPLAPPPTSYTWLFVLLIIGAAVATGAVVLKRVVKPIAAVGAGGGLIVILIVAAILAAPDKAQPAYAQCQVADSMGQVAAAVRACQAAVAADPNSTSGKAAATKLAELKPKYDAWQADQKVKAAAAAEAQRQADAVRAKADAEARAQAAAAARAKIRPKYDGFEPDTTCTAKGLPPFRKDYGGGTLAEDQMVARADGCSPLFPGRDDPMLAVTFCCPK